MTMIPFTKMVGTGNDFVIVDTVRHPLPSLRRQWPALSRALCDRHTGIGADGVLVLEPSRVAEIRMRVFNPDGSEAEMCGNGARCVARYLADRVRRPASRGPRATDRAKQVTIKTRAGVVSAAVRGERVAMRMTDPTGLRLGLALSAGGRTLRLGFVNTGVPHAVVPVERIDQVDVNRLGRALRHHRAFSPRGSNVNFIQMDARRPNRLRVRTYERGVEDETLACGTGVAASAVVYALSRRANGARLGASPDARRGRHRIEVETRSGDVLAVSLRVEGSARARRVRDVVLEGPAAVVFNGTVAVPLRRG